MINFQVSPYALNNREHFLSYDFRGSIARGTQLEASSLKNTSARLPLTGTDVDEVHSI
jgi:hypothetical protein